MKNILESLIESNIESFALDYSNTAKQVFYSPEKESLIHPGEFGMFRERLVRELLTNFLPPCYGVSEGYIIGHNNNDMSTQCDIIIYHKDYTPNFQTSEDQRFFPIESVIAVGEIKSEITSNVLESAINKLAHVKEMRLKMRNSVPAKQREKRKFDPSNDIRQQIVTFILGNSIKCKKQTIEEKLDLSIKNKNYSLKTNLIAGVNDFCVAYILDNKYWNYPVDVDLTPLSTAFIKSNKKKYSHLIVFIKHLIALIEDATVFYPELVYHFNSSLHDVICDEIIKKRINND